MSSASQNQIKVAIVQINSGSNKAENLAKVEALLNEACKEKPDLVCLPEVFNHRGKKDQSIAEAEKIPDGESTIFLSNFAKDNQVWISNGSIFEDAGEELPFNTSIVINNRGEIVEKYRKNHLFKASFKDKEVDESAKSQACIHNCVAKLEINNQSYGIGMSICYDLRFPELYRDYAKQKAEILLVPSSFARKTGEAHWESLLRARAIENQA